MKNSVTIRFTSDSVNESFARVCIASFIAYLDPSIKTIAEIKTAVSEAVTNCVIHGYEGQKGIITLKISVDENIATITVEDKGKGIADIKEAMSPLYTSKPDLERSGMGFTVMKSFTDSLKVNSAPNVGTSVIMTKRII